MIAGKPTLYVMRGANHQISSRFEIFKWEELGSQVENDGNRKEFTNKMEMLPTKLAVFEAEINWLGRAVDGWVSGLDGLIETEQLVSHM